MNFELFLPNHRLPAPTRFYTILSNLALHSVFALFDSTKVFPAKVTWRGTFLLCQCYFLENPTLLKVTHCFQTSLSFILLSIIVTNLVQYVLSSIAHTFFISNGHSVVKATTGLFPLKPLSGQIPWPGFYTPSHVCFFHSVFVMFGGTSDALYKWHSLRSSLKSIISTECALGRTLTCDNHPSNPESQKAKTFRKARFLLQKLSG